MTTLDFKNILQEDQKKQNLTAPCDNLSYHKQGGKILCQKSFKVSKLF